MDSIQERIFANLCPPIEPVLSYPRRLPETQNVVLHGSYECPIKLLHIVRQVTCEYKPKRFSPVIMRLLWPRSTGLLFSTGKFVVVGAQSLEHGRKSAHNYRLLLEALGYRTKLVRLRLTNSVMSFNVGFYVRMERFEDRYPLTTSYKPGIFPGLNFTEGRDNPATEDKGPTFLIYDSGNIVGSGIRSQSVAMRAIGRLIKKLRPMQTDALPKKASDRFKYRNDNKTNNKEKKKRAKPYKISAYSI